MWKVVEFPDPGVRVLMYSRSQSGNPFDLNIYDKEKDVRFYRIGKDAEQILDNLEQEKGTTAFLDEYTIQYMQLIATGQFDHLIILPQTPQDLREITPSTGIKYERIMTTEELDDFSTEFYPALNLIGNKIQKKRYKTNFARAYDGAKQQAKNHEKTKELITYGYLFPYEIMMTCVGTVARENAPFLERMRAEHFGVKHMELGKNPHDYLPRGQLRRFQEYYREAQELFESFSAVEKQRYLETREQICSLLREQTSSDEKRAKLRGFKKIVNQEAFPLLDISVIRPVVRVTRAQEQ